MSETINWARSLRALVAFAAAIAVVSTSIAQSPTGQAPTSPSSAPKTPAANQASAGTPVSWGPFKDVYIVFPKDYKRPRVGQSFPYVPVIQRDPLTGEERLIDPSTVKFSRLPTTTLAYYDPATKFKVAKDILGKPAGGPVPVLNYTPSLVYPLPAQCTEWFMGNHYGHFFRSYDPVFGASVIRFGILPGKGKTSPVREVEETVHFKDAVSMCFLQRTIDYAVAAFAELPYWQTPHEYRQSLPRRRAFLGRWDKRRIRDDRTLAQIAANEVNDRFEFTYAGPHVFIFSRDPNDPLFAVMDVAPGQRHLVAPVPDSSGAKAQLTFYILTLKPENLCYIVSDEVGAPFALCGYDKFAPPRVRFELIVPILSPYDFYIYGREYHTVYFDVHLEGLPFVRAFSVTELSSPLSLAPLATDLAVLAHVYPPYIIATRKQGIDGARFLREHAGETHILRYEKLYPEAIRLARDAQADMLSRSSYREWLVTDNVELDYTQQLTTEHVFTTEEEQRRFNAKSQVYRIDHYLQALRVRIAPTSHFVNVTENFSSTNTITKEIPTSVVQERHAVFYDKQSGMVYHLFQRDTQGTTGTEKVDARCEVESLISHPSQREIVQLLPLKRLAESAQWSSEWAASRGATATGKSAKAPRTAETRHVVSHDRRNNTVALSIVHSGSAKYPNHATSISYQRNYTYTKTNDEKHFVADNRYHDHTWLMLMLWNNERAPFRTIEQSRSAVTVQRTTTSQPATMPSPCADNATAMAIRKILASLNAQAGTAPDWVDLYFGYSPLLVLLFFDVSSDEKARIEKALQGTGAFFDYD
ncbi:MAG: hypothetical protein NZL91_01545, partial [Thermoflexales bacterium]|nr:hypothetical protein [Thermoflexales bacterium]